MNNDTMNQNTQQEPTAQPERTTQPEENGGKTGKVFTQEDVNRIVQERLARDRAGRDATQQQETEEAARVADLTRRENALACREFIMQGGYKPELLDILPTDNAEEFKEKVAKLIELAPLLDPNYKAAHFTTPVRGIGRYGSANEDPLAAAFKPKT